MSLPREQLERTPAELKRLLSPEVGYMEIDEASTGYSCRNCISLPAGKFCLKPQVAAPVSGVTGCCNLFFPKTATVLFPKAADIDESKGIPDRWW